MKELDRNIQRKYSLSNYDSNWVNQFNSIRQLLLGVFGDKAIRIEHVGSTAIFGMKAKPIIDVLVVIEKIEDFTKEKEEMLKAGYDWGDNYIAPNTVIFFRLGKDGERLEHIHVCERDAPKTRQFLVMRDFFRAFPEKAKQYSDLKETNFKKYPNDYLAYRYAKSSFLDQIEREAYYWEESNKNLVQ